MNTRLGKSFGLAFVVAVGILALMFALGTFSAPQAGADVKTGNSKPTFTLQNADGEDTRKPDTAGVTLKVMFQVTDQVAASSSNVTLVLPTSLVGDDSTDSAFDFDEHVKVTQGGIEVGSVSTPAGTVLAAGATGTVQIAAATETGVSNVMPNVLTTIEISNLAIADNAEGEENFSILQGAQTVDNDPDTGLSVTFGPSVSGVSVDLSNKMISAEDVKMTLKFTPDTVSTGLTVGEVDIRIFVNDYRLRADDDSIAYAEGIEVSATQTDNTTDLVVAGLTGGSFVDAAEGPPAVGAHSVITVHTFEADKEVTVTVTGLTNKDTARTVEVTVAQGNQAPAASDTVEVVAPQPVTADVKSSKTTADTATRLTIVSPGETLGDIGPGDDIVINLPKFGLPSSINTADVTISDGTSTANPSEVTISGDNVTLVLGKFTDEDPEDTAKAAGDSHSANVINDDDREVTITIRERAGIKTPTKAGNYPVKVDGKDAADEDGYDIGGDDAEDAMNPMITIVRSLSVKPESAVRGTEITITGKGFTDGGSTVKAGDKTIGTPTIENGSFELKLNNNFKVGSDSAFVKGDEGTDINVTDGAGDEVETPANHTIKATFTIAPESPNPGEEITITLLDIDGSSVNVKFAGEPATGVEATVVNATAGTWKVQVPSDVSPGVVQMTVEVDDDDENQLNKNVTIATNALTVSPSTALVGQEVTVTGSGFTVGEEISDLEIGGVSVLDQIALTARGVASGGRVVAAFRIPNDGALSEAREYTISIKDGTRTGTGTVTIPERTLTVDPAASRIGTTISLSGTNWPTGTGANLVGIYYDGNRYNTATSNSSGSWSASLTVPNDAGVGMTHKVAAKATVGDGGTANVTEEVDHKTPDPVVTLSSGQAQRGTTITVSGENFNIFEVVTIEIGDSDVTPGGTTTDGVGSFSVSVLVPGQALGNKNLKVTVKGVPVVEFLEIVATPVSTTKSAADVFEPLATAGVLTVVWHFDNTTKDWSFYDPRPSVAAAVDLTMVSTGDNVWIQVTADMDFQGESLTTGWNLHTLK